MIYRKYKINLKAEEYDDSVEIYINTGSDVPSHILYDMKKEGMIDDYSDFTDNEWSLVFLTEKRNPFQTVESFFNQISPRIDRIINHLNAVKASYKQW